MNEDWRPTAQALIKHLEAGDVCRCNSYVVPGEDHIQATIGWGRAIPWRAHPMLITKLIADRWLDADITARFQLLCDHVPQPVRDRMTAGQIVAFISWAYNGKGWLTSESFEKLCKGDIPGWMDGAAQWVQGDQKTILPGLVRRRAIELHLATRGVGELDRVRRELGWYMGLVPAVNQSNAHGEKGSLVWLRDRLIWKLA